MINGSGAPWRDILSQIGIDPSTAVAGFSGGVVNVLRIKALNALIVIATIVSSTLIAVYLGEPIAKLVNFPIIPTSFVVGYIGVQVLEYFSTMLRQRLSSGQAPSSTKNNEGTDDGTV